MIPDELIDRPKQGFGVPIYEWLYEKLGTRMREELEDFCSKTDFLDFQEVKRYIDEGAWASSLVFRSRPETLIWAD